MKCKSVQKFKADAHAAGDGQYLLIKVISEGFNVGCRLYTESNLTLPLGYISIIRVLGVRVPLLHCITAFQMSQQNLPGCLKLIEGIAAACKHVCRQNFTTRHQIHNEILL